MATTREHLLAMHTDGHAFHKAAHAAHGKLEARHRAIATIHKGMDGDGHEQLAQEHDAVADHHSDLAKAHKARMAAHADGAAACSKAADSEGLEKLVPTSVSAIAPIKAVPRTGQREILGPVAVDPQFEEMTKIEDDEPARYRSLGS